MIFYPFYRSSKMYFYVYNPLKISKNINKLYKYYNNNVIF